MPCKITKHARSLFVRSVYDRNGIEWLYFARKRDNLLLNLMNLAVIAVSELLSISVL